VNKKSQLRYRESNLQKPVSRHAKFLLDEGRKLANRIEFFDVLEYRCVEYKTHRSTLSQQSEKDVTKTMPVQYTL
jgi:hypothetical protein